MSLPTFAVKQSVAPTTTASGSTFHFACTPSGLGSAGYLLCLGVEWSTTTRTFSSIAATGINWTLAVPKTVPTGQAAIAQFFGVATATTSITTTITLNGTPGSVASFLQEFQFTGLPSAPSWSVDAQSCNFNPSGKTTPALTSAMAGAKYGDFMYAALWDLAAGASSANTPQSWLTYDLTNVGIYGVVPSDQTVPATGFNLSATDDWALPAMILNSGVVPEPTLWVPPTVGMDIF
jgi:hypothetical protein